MKIEKRKNAALWSAAALALSLFARNAESQSLWRPGARCGYLIADRTARRIGDTLTIVISEQQSIQDKNNTKLERTSSSSMKAATIRLQKHSPIFTPELAFEGSNKMDAKADEQKTGSFSTTITSVVVDVQPNGNLIVNGRRKIFLDQEEKTIEITGIVRPYDINAANTVLSTQIADARITFIGDGPVAEVGKKGWFARQWDKFWNAVWPF